MERTDISYGVIPLRQIEGEWRTLVIEQFSKIGNNSYWVFPKGHPEGEEAPVETAKRELFEETGLVPKTLLTKPSFTINYSFTFNDDLVKKTVEFYLAHIPDGELTLDPEEVKTAHWLPLGEALKKIDYKDTQQMFQAVIEYIKKTDKIFD